MFAGSCLLFPILRTALHSQTDAEHMKIYSAAISSAKSDYYSHFITSSEGNARTLFFLC